MKRQEAVGKKAVATAPERPQQAPKKQRSPRQISDQDVCSRRHNIEFFVACTALLLFSPLPHMHVRSFTRTRSPSQISTSIDSDTEGAAKQGQAGKAERDSSTASPELTGRIKCKGYPAMSSPTLSPPLLPLSSLCTHTCMNIFA